MAVYIVKCNPLSGCLEPTKVSGNESLTLGCVWNSTDVASTINDCDGCQLAQLNQTSVALGLDAAALNNGISLGLGASSTCTAIALGCGTTATDNGIAIGTNLTACCDEVLIGDKVILDNNCVSLGNGDIYAKVCCDCIDVKGCSVVANVNTDKVVIGASVTGSACSVAIGANASVSAARSTAVGYCASVSCAGVAIGTCSNADNYGVGSGYHSNAGKYGVAIGTCSNADNYGVGSGYNSNAGKYGVAIGYSANTICYGVAIGYYAKTCCSYTNAIGYGVTADTGCQGDTFIGYCSNVFKFCGTTGYTYGNGCLMTGRILNDASELPATNCQLLLYYVP